MINSITGIGGAAGVGRPELPFNTGSSATSFADTLKRALNEVGDMQDNARDVIGAFLRGEHVELHEVMAATEEAGLALDMLIEMRNKMTDAYRTIINMQS